MRPSLDAAFWSHRQIVIRPADRPTEPGHIGAFPVDQAGFHIVIGAQAALGWPRRNGLPNAGHHGWFWRAVRANPPKPMLPRSRRCDAEASIVLMSASTSAIGRASAIHASIQALWLGQRHRERCQWCLTIV